MLMPMTSGSPPSPTHYDVLEVSPRASAPTIRAAYKSLMQRHHPDRLPSADAKHHAQRINAAYEILADAEQRRRYDAELARSRAGSSAESAPRSSGTAPDGPRPSPASPGPAGRSVTPASRIAVAVATLLLFLIGIGGWWWTTPQTEWQVGTVQYDPGSPVVQVVARLAASRDEQGIAQAHLVFRTADHRPFRVNGQEVVIGHSLVRYDCGRRQFTATQNRMLLTDGTAVDLVDNGGDVTPRSASERAMELACTPWWRRWNLR